MIDPTSNFRKYWDGLAFVSMLFLAISIPVWVAFYAQSNVCDYFALTYENIDTNPPAPPIPLAWNILCTITTIVFIVDIVLNFLTGTVNSKTGQKKYELKATAIEYAKTYLIIDVISFFPLQCILVESLDGRNIYNAGLLIRLVRLFGMSRRVHGSPLKLLELFYKDIATSIPYILRQVFSWAAIFLFVIHVYSCAVWLAIRAQDYPALTFPVQLDIAGLDVPVSEQWLFSYFAVTSAAIGLGYGSYAPVTWPEVLVWIFAMLSTAGLFAIINGTIFNYIFNSNSGEQEYKSLWDDVYENIYNKGISQELKDRVNAYIEARHPGMKIDNFTNILAQLPPSLQGSILNEIFLRDVMKDALNYMDIFKEFPELKQAVLPFLKPEAAVKDQELSLQGDPITTAYFLVSGVLMVKHTDKKKTSKTIELIGPGKAFNDSALLQVPLSEDDATLEVVDAQTLKKEDQIFTTLLNPDIRKARHFRSPVSVVAFNTCMLYALDGDDFRSVLVDYPAAAARIKEIGEQHWIKHVEMKKQAGPVWKRDPDPFSFDTTANKEEESEV